MAFKNAIKSETQGLMTIFVETLTGTTFEIKVSPQDRVKSIKSKIQRVEGIPVSQQHLLYNCRELPDSSCVSEPGVALHDRATLKLVLSMRGGPISLVHQPMPLNRTLLRNLVKLNRESQTEDTPRMAVLVLRIGDQLNLLHVVEDDDSDSNANSNDDVATTEFEREENPKSIEENSVTLGKVCDLKERMDKLSLDRKSKKAGNNSSQIRPLEDTEIVIKYPSRNLPSLSSRIEGVTLKSRSEFSQVPILPDIIPQPLSNASRDFELVSFEGETSTKMSEAMRPKTCPATLRESQFYDLYEEEEYQNPLQITQPQFRSCVSACATNHEWRGGKTFLQSLSVLPPIDRVPDVLNNHRKATDESQRDFEANSISSLEQLNLHRTRRNSIKFNQTMRVESQSSMSRKDGLVRNNPDLPGTSGAATRGTSVSKELFPLASSEPSKHLVKPWTDAPARLNSLDVSGASETAPSRTSITQELFSLSSKDSLRTAVKSWTDSPYWLLTDETKDYTKINHLEPLESNKKDNVDKKSRLRCSECRKRLSLAGTFECRCGLTFCSYHRYAETHRCTYDFKKESRKLLEQANPSIVTPKLPKM